MVSHPCDLGKASIKSSEISSQILLGMGRGCSRPLGESVEYCSAGRLNMQLHISVCLSSSLSNVGWLKLVSVFSILENVLPKGYHDTDVGLKESKLKQLIKLTFFL